MRKNAVIYEIYPKSFQDSNQDGIGDLQGIIQRLDYLQDLGIDYLWITPFCVSPQNDNGYDVADYYAIDPLFGTMADFERLVFETKKRNMNIIMDMVFNHTSIHHQWFQNAINGAEKYQNYYFFKEGSAKTAPNNWVSKFGGKAWNYLPSLKKWYLHLFDVSQADLDWTNKDVRNEMQAIINFWSQKGVTGFRFDVINLISKTTFANDNIGDGRRLYTDQPLVHNYLQELRTKSFGKIEDSISIGELSSTTIEKAAKYTSNKDELDLVFTFHHLKVDYVNNQKWTYENFKPEKLINVLKKWQLGMQSKNGWLANFLNNHDQPRSVSRFGNSKYHYESATALAILTFALQGTPVLYQGEEIGMTNNSFQMNDFVDIESINYLNILKKQNLKPDEIMKIVNSKSRDNARTPMQWDSSKNAGFSSTKPWIKVNDNFKTINVANQLKEQNSILSFYKKLIILWKQENILKNGKIEFIDMHRNILAFKRILHGEVIVIINLSAEKIAYESYNKPEILLTNYQSNVIKDVLQPYEAIILKQ